MATEVSSVAYSLKYICRAGVGPFIIIVMGPCDGIITADGNGRAKVVVGCAVRGEKLGLLVPAKFSAIGFSIIDTIRPSIYHNAFQIGCEKVFFEKGRL